MGNYVVTGGATGIGRDVVKLLQKDAHRVLVVDIRDGDVVADLATKEGRERAVRETAQWCSGRLDGVVACAGVGPHTPSTELIVRLNYFGVVDFVMKTQGLLASSQGAAVLVSSNTAGLYEPDRYSDMLIANGEEQAVEYARTLDSQHAYAGAKYALAHWLRSQAATMAGRGVRINAVAPGFIKTPLTDAGLADPVFGPAIADYVETIPLGREGQPLDVARAIRFLLSDDASYISGSILFIDGGHDAMFRPERF